jgi:hypothetical protein
VYTPGYVYPAYPQQVVPYAAPPAVSVTPTPQPLSPAPQTGVERSPQPSTLDPAAPRPPAAAAPSPQSCQTVWVEGYYETRVLPGGQHETAWVPAHSREICR